VLAVRGDRAAAEARLKPLLAGSDPDWSTIHVAACLAIESGDLDRAAAFSKRLRATDAGHADVIDGLVDGRRKRATERVNEALARAWKAAGKPDLSTHQLAHTAASELPALDREALERLGPGAALVFEPSSDRGIM
jgi:hypothetical protein